jgi:hypothetical protein
MIPTVSVLCVGRSTVYRQFPQVETFNRKRDVWSCQSRRPIVAHPPCRFWSRWNQRAAATVSQIVSEMLIAMECLRLCRANGGVLEQPAFSRLWHCARLPRPDTKPSALGEFTIEIDQAEYGHHCSKRTWLLLCGIRPDQVTWQGFQLANPRQRTLSKLTPGQRSATPPRLASWLVELASIARPQLRPALSVHPVSTQSKSGFPI